MPSGQVCLIETNTFAFKDKLLISIQDPFLIISPLTFVITIDISHSHSAWNLWTTLYIIRDSAWLRIHRGSPPRLVPSTHVIRAYVHACARHRQVLSNRRVLSIINVYRMRNRVQARAHVPPTVLRPRSSSFVHPPTYLPLSPLQRTARFLPHSHFARSENAFMKIRPVVFRVAMQRGCRSTTRYRWLLSSLFFSSFLHAGVETFAGTSERTKELMAGIHDVFFIFFPLRAIVPFFLSLRR